MIVVLKENHLAVKAAAPPPAGLLVPNAREKQRPFYYESLKPCFAFFGLFKRTEASFPQCHRLQSSIERFQLSDEPERYATCRWNSFHDATPCTRNCRGTECLFYWDSPGLWNFKQIRNSVRILFSFCVGLVGAKSQCIGRRFHTNPFFC